MRRLSVALVCLVLFASGCLSSFFLRGGEEVPNLPPTNTILSVKALSEANPLPEAGEVDEGTSLPAPLEGRMYVTEWVREESFAGDSFTITISLKNEYAPTYFKVVFAGYEKDQPMDYAYISDPFFAPGHWEGTMVFDVPLGHFYGLYGVSIWTSLSGKEEDYRPREAAAFVPPCPEHYAWPEPFTYQDCLDEVAKMNQP